MFDYEKIQNSIIKFDEISALVFWSIIIVVLFFTVINPSLNNDLTFVIRIIIFVVLWLLMAGCWFINKFRLPRNSVNKIGIVLSIYAENKKEIQEIKQDIIQKIQINISERNLSKLIKIIPIPNHLSKNLNTIDDLKKIHRIIHGHFYIIGKIKCRNENGPKNYIELNGLVYHAFINLNLSNELSVEFRKSLPREIIDDPSFQMRQIKVSSETITTSAKYIIGIAALLSNDPSTAIKLHQELYTELSTKKDLNREESYFLNQTQKHLSFENMVMANHYLLVEKNNVKFKEYFNKAQEYYPDGYSVLLITAIEKFEHNNIDGALSDIVKAKEIAFGRQEWRYSEAFLFYWRGEYEKAYRSSNKLADHDFINKETVSYQVINFNNEKFKKNSSKIQLLFWIGFIYHKCLGIPTEAFKYFEDFIKKGNPQSMGYLIEKAKIFNKEIEENNWYRK